MLNLRRKNPDQRGDTIVEVLVTLAILGLAFSIAYATANHSLMLARNSEEHAEATQYLQSQIEQIRSSIAKDATTLTTMQNYYPGAAIDHQTFCFGSDGNLKPGVLVDGTNNPDCAFGQGSLYQVAVQYVPQPNEDTPPPADTTQSYFKGVITWPGIGELGQQQVQLNYRIF